MNGQFISSILFLTTCFSCASGMVSKIPSRFKYGSIAKNTRTSKAPFLLCTGSRSLRTKELMRFTCSRNFFSSAYKQKNKKDKKREQKQSKNFFTWKKVGTIGALSLGVGGYTLKKWVETDDESLLHKAIEFENPWLIKLLLKSNYVFINHQNKKGETPLIKLAKKGDYRFCEMFLKNKRVKINIQDNMGNSALMWAVQSAYEDVVELLLFRDDINLDLKNKNNKTVFDLITEEIHNCEAQKGSKGIIKKEKLEKIKRSLINVKWDQKELEAKKGEAERRFQFYKYKLDW